MRLAQTILCFYFFTLINAQIPCSSDAQALTYCITNSRTFIAIVWPATQKYTSHDKIESILKKYGLIVYKKRIALANNGPLLLIKHAYGHESWLGSWQDNFRGIRTIKENICFPPSVPKIIDVYLLDYGYYQQAYNAKHAIRRLFPLSFNSIHITDNHAESISLARILFNNNSIHYLNNARLQYAKKFEDRIQKYKRWLYLQPHPEEFCIVEKAVKSLYGHSDCKTLSIITTQPTPRLPRYCKKEKWDLGTISEIVHNHEKYLMYHEVKFLASHRPLS